MTKEDEELYREVVHGEFKIPVVSTYPRQVNELRNGPVIQLKVPYHSPIFHPDRTLKEQLEQAEYNRHLQYES